MSKKRKKKKKKKKKKGLYNLIILNTFLFQLLQLVDVFSFSSFASLVGVPIGITSSAIGLKICATTAGIKKYKSIFKKKKRDKMVFLAKSKLDRMQY